MQQFWFDFIYLFIFSNQIRETELQNKTTKMGGHPGNKSHHNLWTIALNLSVKVKDIVWQELVGFTFPFKLFSCLCVLEIFCIWVFLLILLLYIYIQFKEMEHILWQTEKKVYSPISLKASITLFFI